MQSSTSKKKLLVLLNLSGSYKGGAQRRYLALFNYLQQTNKNEYFLLLNKSLYDACYSDKILTSNKNVICVSFYYDKKYNSKNNIIASNGYKKYFKSPEQKSKGYTFLGSVSSFLKQFRGWFSYSLQLLKIIKKMNIGVIYGVFTGGIWSWQAARLLRIKLIYSYNDASASMIDNSILKIFNSEYYPLKFANKVDLLSEGIKNRLHENGVNLETGRTIFSPCSFILYENFKPEYPKKNWIVFSSRLTKFKNPQLLLEAVMILKEKGFTDFEVYYLGEGILLEELIYQNEKLNLGNVFFEGGVSDTAKYLKQSEIFISIQQDNNYPSQSLLEAMACENAIIASDVGETRKLVTENEGILVPLNGEKIADAIQYLLENPAECERLGKNARKKATEEHNIEKYSKYFFEIME